MTRKLHLCPGQKEGQYGQSNTGKEEVGRRPCQGGRQGTAQAEPGEEFGFYSKCYDLIYVGKT